jgi:hypothetical protein
VIRESLVPAATSYGVSYLSWSYLNEELRNAYMKTGDTESTLTILACLGDVGGRQRRPASVSVDLPGLFAHQVLLEARGKQPERIEALLTVSKPISHFWLST